jgi:sterol desaturase/sphingolipid hydroxylase (fatty acid hydroxylase superfamily)
MAGRLKASRFGIDRLAEIERTGWGLAVSSAPVRQDHQEVPPMTQFISILDEFRQIWLYIFAGDLARYLIGAGSVFFSSALFGHDWQPEDREIPAGRSDLAGDRVIAVTVCIFATVGTSIGIGSMHGVFQVYTDVSLYGWPYLVGSVVAMIVVQDAYFYWVHRLMHRVPLLWKVHATHHRSHNPTPWTAYAFDPGEALIHALFMPMFVAIVPMHVGGLFAFTAHMMLRNAIGHCGYELFPKGWADRPILGLVTMVTHHDMHHEHAPRIRIATWWDRLMGDIRNTDAQNDTDNGMPDSLKGAYVTGRAESRAGECLRSSFWRAGERMRNDDEFL